ncbi:SAM-dependent methyltransferase [Amycolatopsis sp. NPDC004378]
MPGGVRGLRRGPVAHSRVILEGNPNATVVAADLCRPHAVLGTPAVQTMLDFTRPIGLLLVAVFHFVPDHLRPPEIVADYRAALPPGSLVALSHLTADHAPREMAAVTAAMKHSRDPMYFRPYNEVVALFDGLEIVEPGVLSAPLWRPEPGIRDIAPDDVYAGVGRQP